MEPDELLDKLETQENAIQNLGMLIGMAKVACPLSEQQERCAIDSVFMLARAAGIKESEIYRLVGIDPV